MGPGGTYYAEFEIVSGSAMIGVALIPTNDAGALAGHSLPTRGNTRFFGVQSVDGLAVSNNSQLAGWYGRDELGFQQGDTIGLRFTCGWAHGDSCWIGSSYWIGLAAYQPQDGCLTVFKNGARMGVAVLVKSMERSNGNGDLVVDSTWC